jgi:histidine ammonia-lyase
MITFGAVRVSVDDVVAGAQEGGHARLADGVAERVARSRVVVERYVADERAAYGLTTGLGGNVGHRVGRDEVPDFQMQILRGRMIGMGDPLPRHVSRAALFCRIVELAGGGTGVSLPPIETLVAMYDRGVTPVVPRYGSIGASDMGIVTHLVAPAVGLGEAFVGGERLPGAAALAKVGLSPAMLQPKDGLGLISHGAVGSATAALALDGLRRLIDQHGLIVGLAYEGFRANPAILDARLHAARPAAGQIEAAARLRRVLEGSYLYRSDAGVGVQDAISFRNIAPVLGTLLAALDAALAELETEINGVTCSPIVFAEDGDMLSGPNYHASSLALALDAVAIALTHFAWASALRSCKLMTAAFSGLPKYLSPVGGGSAGYVSLQKTAGGLYAELRRGATPMLGDALLVSDTAEDLTPLTLQSARKLDEQLAPLRYLAAIEALAAAQAVDLRGVADRLAPRTRALYEAIRRAVPPLERDRPPGADVEAVRAALDDLLSDGAA